MFTAHLCCIESAEVRFGRYARDHLVLRDPEFYEDDRDLFGD